MTKIYTHLTVLSLSVINLCALHAQFVVEEPEAMNTTAGATEAATIQIPTVPTPPMVAPPEIVPDTLQETLTRQPFNRPFTPPVAGATDLAAPTLDALVTGSNGVKRPATPLPTTMMPHHSINSVEHIAQAIAKIADQVHELAKVIQKELPLLIGSAPEVQLKKMS